MKTPPFIQLKLSGVIALGFAVMSGCAYRLPVYNVPSQQRLMIVSRSPEHYVARVEASDTPDFPVASDGRVVIDVPRLPRVCSVYLFDLIRIRSGVEPLTTKSVQLIDSGKVATKLSLAEIAKLPTDASGYHIVNMKR